MGTNDKCTTKRFIVSFAWPSSCSLPSRYGDSCCFFLSQLLCEFDENFVTNNKIRIIEIKKKKNQIQKWFGTESNLLPKIVVFKHSVVSPFRLRKTTCSRKRFLIGHNEAVNFKRIKKKIKN